MRNIYLLAFSILIMNSSFTQVLGPKSPFFVRNMKLTYVDNIFGRPVNLAKNENISGSPYLSEEYKKGNVLLKNGYYTTDVPVKFNVYNNEIIFTQNGAELALDSVLEVSYADASKDSAGINRLRAGYPAINNKTPNTIYQVLAGDKNVQLLKYIYKKIEEKKTMGYANLKEFYTYEELYLYSLENGIQKIRLNQKNIEEALPSKEGQIAKIIAENNLNVKKHDDMIKLIAELDRAN